MIHADAGFANKDEAPIFCLPGHAKDFENRALICFLKNEPLPVCSLSVNELAAAIMLADRWDVQDLGDLVLKTYLHKEKLTKEEQLKYSHFRHIRRTKPPEVLKMLLECEGNIVDSVSFSERLSLLETQNAEDRVLSDTSITTLAEKGTWGCIAGVLGSIQKFERLHGRLCESIGDKKRTFATQIELAKAGFYVYNFSWKDKVDLPQSTAEFRKGFESLSKIDHNLARSQATAELLRMMYYNKTAAAMPILGFKAQGIITYIWPCHEFPDQIAIVGVMVQGWILYQQNEHEINVLKEELNKAQYGVVFPVNTFVKLSQTLTDPRNGEKLISDGAFREQVARYFT
jgi:hypothetical protein